VADGRFGAGHVHHQLGAGVEQGGEPRRVPAVTRSRVGRG
jgi:hypothetical protein